MGPWLSRIAPRRARGALTIAIVTDGTVRALNRKYRGINRTTDVLSFPGGKSERKGGSRYLGDIVIGRGVARKQARKLGHSLGVELRVLALHGLLHLLGYDHEVDSGQMARQEARLRRKAGLPHGLIARSA